jgi:hypothetical protein
VNAGNSGLSQFSMTLAEAIKTRFPHNSERSQLIRQRLAEVCNVFVASDYGDGNAMQKLCSADDTQYWQQLSEVLIPVCSNA